MFKELNLNISFDNNLEKYPDQQSLEEKLKDEDYPLEEYLKHEDAISNIKLMGKNTKKYFNSEKN